MIPVREHFPPTKPDAIFFPSKEYARYEKVMAFGKPHIACFPSDVGIESLEPSYSRLTLYDKELRNQQYKKLSDIKLLVELLQLAMQKFDIEKTWVKEYNEFHEDSGFSIKDDSASDVLLSLFSKYGVFYRDGFSFSSWYLATTENSIPEIPGFDPINSVYHISNLYDVYKCWCYLAGERGFSMEFAEQKIKELSESSNPIISIEEACRYFINAEGYYACPEIRYAYEGEQLKPQFYCDSLFSALTYQLLTFISLGEAGLDGCVSICTTCGRQFLKKHGNASLCEQCRTPRAKSKAFRDKQRAKKNKEEV